jgi:hypothetical protein
MKAELYHNSTILFSIFENFPELKIDFTPIPCIPIYENETFAEEILFNVYNAIHEISHYQVSPKSTRHLKNFGLGATRIEKALGNDFKGIFTIEEEILLESRVFALSVFWYQFFNIYENWPSYDRIFAIKQGCSEKFIPFHRFPLDKKDNVLNYLSEKRNKEDSFELGEEILTEKAFDWLLEKNLLDHNFNPTFNLNTSESL